MVEGQCGSCLELNALVVMPISHQEFKPKDLCEKITKVAMHLRDVFFWQFRCLFLSKPKVFPALSDSAAALHKHCSLGKPATEIYAARLPGLSENG